jgi:hypothetical protein
MSHHRRPRRVEVFGAEVPGLHSAASTEMTETSSRTWSAAEQCLLPFHFFKRLARC